MRVLYGLSEGKADLSKVYARLSNRRGIVSEDVSHGAGLFLDRTPAHHLELDLLKRVFDDATSELERTTFWAESGDGVRKPIIDLDHVMVRPEFKDRIDQLARGYEHDSRFIIEEFPQKS